MMLKRHTLELVRAALWVGLTLGLCGCDSKTDRAKRLVHEQTYGDLSLRISYLPWDHFAEREITPEHTRAQKDSILKHYRQQLYFLVTMTAKGREPIYAASRTQAEYSERVQKLSFAAGQYFRLVTERDSTLYPLTTSFPRLYGASGSNQLLVVFRNEPYLKETSRVDLVISDLTFGLPASRYQFQVDDMERASIHDIRQNTNL